MAYLITLPRGDDVPFEWIPPYGDDQPENMGWGCKLPPGWNIGPAD